MPTSFDATASTRKLAVALLALVLLLLQGACTSIISRPAPVKGTFLLDPPLPAAVGGAPKSAVLRIGAINVAAPFRAKSFVYRKSDLGYEADYYNEFFVPPGTMLADVLARSLSAARVFERVVPAGAAGNEGDFLLDGFVSAMYGDVRTPGKPTAEFAVTFYVTPMAELGSAPVWTHEYHQRASLAADTPEALAQAFNAAVGAVAQELAKDLAAATLRR